MQPNVYICVALPIISALVMNSVIAIRGWSASERKKCALLPPGFVIGIVWTLILGFLGYTWYLVWEDVLAHFSIVVLVVFCLLYPVATRLADSVRFDKLLNLTALVLAFMTSLATQYAVPSSLYWMAPILVWTMYVNYATVFC